jgi:hypothetical protein
MNVTDPLNFVSQNETLMNEIRLDKDETPNLFTYNVISR